MKEAQNKNKPCGCLGNNTPFRGNNKCKISETEACLASSLNIKEITIDGESEEGRVIGDESRGSKESRYMKTECYSEMRSHWRVLSREVSVTIFMSSL